LTFTSFAGYGKVALIQLARVDVGSISFQNVDFVAYDLPQVTGFDVILGRSLLQFVKLEFDYSTGQLRMEETKKVAGL
jgi:predicted aspartyl protease